MSHLKSMKPNLTTVLWDFDGVIIESMAVRDDAFRNALCDYPDAQVEALVAYHRLNGGLSRYHKFRHFFETIRKEETSNAEIEELAETFSQYCLNRLKSRDCLIPESINFIEAHHQNLEFHIVSGSAQHELRIICEELGIRGYFGEILGSPTPKSDLVRTLIESLDLDLAKTGLVGDSRNDYDAAFANGVRFFGYRNTDLRGFGVYLERIGDLPVES